MPINDIDPEFADNISDDDCVKLITVLPQLLPEVLPDSNVHTIVIKPYATQLKIGSTRLPAGVCFRVICTCAHGTEQIILGESEPGRWLHLRVPHSNTHTSHT